MENGNYKVVKLTLLSVNIPVANEDEINTSCKEMIGMIFESIILCVNREVNDD